MGRMIRTARYVPDPVPVQEVYRGNGITELVKGIDAFEFRPRRAEKVTKKRRTRKKPEWLELLIILSAVMPQIYCLMFFAQMYTHPVVFSVIVVSSQVWAWIVLIANCIGRKNKDRSSRN